MGSWVRRLEIASINDDASASFVGGLVAARSLRDCIAVHAAPSTPVFNRDVESVFWFKTREMSYENEVELTAVAAIESTLAAAGATELQ